MTSFEIRTNGPAGKETSPPPDVVTGEILSEMDDVEKNLQSWSQSSNPLIAEVSRYIFQEKGKRLRPALLLLSARLAGHRGPEDAFFAALIEIIHTASLIHDDIIDNASMRRGRESVHSKWGPNITVLLGDYLFIKSIGLSLRSKDRRIVHLLADLSARMIEGELTEYFYRGKLDITEHQYLDIVSKKTASLFAAACQIGGILGRASPEEESRLMEIGHNLGMSFQIIDDLLDFAGDEKTLGKSILSDLAEGRVTLPLIHALRSDGKAADGRWTAGLLRKDLDDGAKKDILETLKTSGSLDYAFRKAEAFSSDARDGLDHFSESPFREAIIGLSRFVLERKR